MNFAKDPCVAPQCHRTGDGLLPDRFHAHSTACCVSRVTPAQGSCTSGAGSSACRSHSPCQVSVIQDVIWRDSSELAGRGRSFGALYAALPRHSGAAARSLRASHRCVLFQPGRCSGAKGKERPFRGTTRSKMLLFYAPASPSRRFDCSSLERARQLPPFSAGTGLSSREFQPPRAIALHL